METKAFDAGKVATLPAWPELRRLGSELPLALGDAPDAGATKFPGENSNLHSSFWEKLVADAVRYGQRRAGESLSDVLLGHG